MLDMILVELVACKANFTIMAVLHFALHDGHVLWLIVRISADEAQNGF